MRGLQGTGDTRSIAYIWIIFQVLVPLGICFVIQPTGTVDKLDIRIAILIAHVSRCALSMVRFNQGRWRRIVVNTGVKVSVELNLAVEQVLTAGGCSISISGTEPQRRT